MREENQLINHCNEDEISLDTAAVSSLLWSKTSRNTENALSRDKAKSDKAAWQDKAALDARKTVICDDFWDDFVLMSKVCLLRDPEADLFDVFDTIRTKFMGGWGFTIEQLNKLDAEIESDYKRGKF